MAEISATAVKSLREQTGLPLMECKRALTESAGDVAAAIEYLRKQGKAKMIGRAADRETSFGRLAVWASIEPPVGSIIEIRCESAPVASHEEFIKLAHNLAEQLALGPGAATPDALLDEPSPGQARQHAPPAVRRSEQPHPRGLPAGEDAAAGRSVRRLRTP